MGELRNNAAPCSGVSTFKRLFLAFNYGEGILQDTLQDLEVFFVFTNDFIERQCAALVLSASARAGSDQLAILSDQRQDEFLGFEGHLSLLEQRS
jgi:hypothetical protein